MSHNIFSPSSASRWSKCVPSALLREQLGFFESYSNPASSAGVEAHKRLEELLKAYRPRIFGEYKHLEIDETSMSTAELYAAQAYNYIMVTLQDAERGETFCHLHSFLAESKLAWALPSGRDVGGTVDAIAIFDSPSEKEQTIHLFDLKTGVAEYERAYNHYQLLLYARAALRAFDRAAYPITAIHLHIVQPSLSNYNSYKYTRNQIVTLTNQIVKRLLDDNLTYQAGDHCKYCVFKIICPLTREALRIIMETLETKKPLTFDQKIQLLKSKEAITRMLAEIEQEIKNSILMGGESIDGISLEPITPRRKYQDEKEAELFLQKELGDSAFKKSLLSPAQAEKELSEKIFSAGEASTKKAAKEDAKEILSQYLVCPEPTEHRLVVNCEIHDEELSEKELSI